MANRRITVGSMFAGIGGICLGFKQSGFDVIWANEVDAAACRTYRYNFGNSYLVEADIKDLNKKSIPKFDVLTAGFPCQPFSVAGKQKGFGDNRGFLFFEILEVAQIVKPKIIFLENVANLIVHDKGKTFLIMRNMLRQLGYLVYYKVLSADEYGNVPQTRKRVYIVAIREDVKHQNFRHPEPLCLTCNIEDIVKRNYQKDKMYYYGRNTKMYDYLKINMPDKTAIYRITDAGVRKTRDNKCPTLIANMGTYPNRIPVIWDDYGIRKLTLRECLDFQGFTKNFYFPNTIKINDAYKQIGNSVCVPVIKRIAEQVKMTLI